MSRDSEKQRKAADANFSSGLPSGASPSTPAWSEKINSSAGVEEVRAERPPVTTSIHAIVQLGMRSVTWLG